MSAQTISLESFDTFGEFLKFLRRRERLTQLELSIEVGYSEAQISRLEKNQRLPDLAALKALFIPALHLEDEPVLSQRLLDLAQVARQEDLPSPGAPPYKGLLFFDEADANLFFGREALIARLTARLNAPIQDSTLHFLAIIGASGSGKSSLVRAGLVPNLKRAGWDTCVFTPTEQPLKMLADQLHAIPPQRHPEKTLILVDQFEEVFTLCRDESARSAYIENLLTLAQTTAVVVTLRADFYGYCAQYPHLREAVASSQAYIGPMTAAELRLAIEKPAIMGGWELEPGFVDILMQDIGAQGTREPEPGALPLLSHALLATWERRRGKVLTVVGYRASGGVRGAITETAESVYLDQLNSLQRQYTRDIFLRLTELGEGTEDTRRRASLTEFVFQGDVNAMMEEVLNKLAEARLIILSENSAEVAHEALIREWQRLREWLKEDREGLRLYRKLTEATHEWIVLGHDSGALYRGARLAQTHEWIQSHPDRLLTVPERAFMAASIQQEEHEAREQEAQRQRELVAAKLLAGEQERRAEEQFQAARRIRRGAVILAFALIAALILAGAALFFNYQANENARAAIQASRMATSRELASSSISQLDTNPELSILLGLQALNVMLKAGQPPLIEAQSALHRALQTSRLQMTLRGHLAEIVGVAVSPDGMHIASLSKDGELKLWSLPSGKEEQSIQTRMTLPPGNSSHLISFSPDGKLLAAPAGSHLAKVWEVASGRELVTLSGHNSGVNGIVFSPDGARLATAGVDGTVKVWDATSGQALLNIIASEGNSKAALTSQDSTRLAINWVAFSPDGTRLATTNTDGNSILWDIPSGKALLSFQSPDTSNSIAFSPQGDRLAVSNNNTTWTLWDLSTGKKLVTGYGHTSIIYQVVFDSTGKKLASVSADGTARLWEVDTGRELLSLAGHASGVLSVAFSPNDQQLITGSFDKTVKVWDLSPQAGREWFNLAGHTDRVFDVAYSPDGRYIATAGVDNFVNVWDAGSGKVFRSFQSGDAGVSGVAFGPDGNRLFAAVNDTKKGSAVIVWEIETGKQIQAFRCSVCARMALSRDGRLLATSADFQGDGMLWDVQSGKDLFTLSGHTDVIQGLAFSPDGKHLATASQDGSARVWDVTTGKTIYVLPGKIALFRVTFSPDGKLLATSGNDGAVHVWDAANGQPRYLLTGHTGTTFGVAFSPDGRYLATSSVDRTVKIWEVAAGANVQPLTLGGHTAAVYAVAFSPDGSRLVTASRDGTARVYALRLEDLIAIAKTRITRGLTAEECQQFLHLPACPQNL